MWRFARHIECVWVVSRVVHNSSVADAKADQEAPIGGGKFVHSAAKGGGATELADVAAGYNGSVVQSRRPGEEGRGIHRAILAAGTRLLSREEP